MPRVHLFQQSLWFDLIAGLSAFGMAFCAAQPAEVCDER
ncbi:hypothetical protein [Pseudomonas sp. 8 R 14]|jgi:hypothetical protein|nr:hypothetical protein [Pseudomonas sp. 8 R 14]SAM33474.1 hypothetical protein BN1864_LIB5394:03521 [Pseudomonas sp. 1 R 17]